MIFILLASRKSTERPSYVEAVISREPHSLSYDVCSDIVIYALRDLATLTTDQGACETVICIPIGTMDYIKSKTNSLNLNQRTCFSPDSRNAWHPILRVKQMTGSVIYGFCGR